MAAGTGLAGMGLEDNNMKGSGSGSEGEEKVLLMSNEWGWGAFA